MNAVWNDRRVRHCWSVLDLLDSHMLQYIHSNIMALFTTHTHYFMHGWFDFVFHIFFWYPCVFHKKNLETKIVNKRKEMMDIWVQIIIIGYQKQKFQQRTNPWITNRKQKSHQCNNEKKKEQQRQWETNRHSTMIDWPSKWQLSSLTIQFNLLFVQ